MLEEKTTETRQDGTPPAQPPKKRGEKMRSHWARLQTRHVLHRHHLRRKTSDAQERLAQRLRALPLVLWLGELFYSLGFATEYAVVRVARTIRNAVLFCVRWCVDFLRMAAAVAFPGAKQAVHDLVDPVVVFVRGCGGLLAHAHRVRKQEGFAAAFRAAVHYFAGGIRRNARLLPRMAMYVLPLCALAVMVGVFRYTVQRPYALAVEVNGQTVGYVANETVFNSAREAVQERINYAGTNRTQWTVEPIYTLSAGHDVLDENEMANAILQSAGDEISEGTALYLDGQLTAVCADGNALQNYLDSLLKPYEDEGSSDTTVTFNKEVTMEKGVYFTDSFEDMNSVEQMLTGVQTAQKTYTVKSGDTLWAIAQKNDLTFQQLCELNPDFKGAPLTEKSNIQEGDTLTVTKEEAMLEVRITKTETTDEEIPFTTETTNSDEYEKGTTKTLQEGENGIRRVTSRNVYDTNGVLLESTILSTEVVKEAVPKKVVVGTKKPANKNGAASYITGSGRFTWPVPGYKYCSRWYGSGHNGVDICAAAGTPIYATAAGTVSKAGYNKAGAGTGYGYSIVISHAGGYSSVYAHCSSLVVHAGQSVKQGQLIGYVGSTGRSSGNHCHFEIRLNGSYVPPQNVFNRSSYR